MQKYKIGIDEAGRGPWAGPVVAASFCVSPKHKLEPDLVASIRDSKKLSEKKRQAIFEQLTQLGAAGEVLFGVGVVDNFYIDEHGIKAANKEAMRRSLLEIKRKIDTRTEHKIEVFVDGNDNYQFAELERKPIYIIGGDDKVLEISAASIIAKVFRDKLMQQYGELYPALDFGSHKGYGTKKHRGALGSAEDVTNIHRTSYKPVQAVLKKKPKLLLHICCGPDTCVPVMDLKKDYEVICFWYDPNIQPRSEHDKRLEAFKKVCAIEEVEYIVGEYDVANFFKEIQGLEHTPEKGDKCTKCYDMRLRRTALEARKRGIHYWTSTLNNSPHKDLEKMFTLGDKWSIQSTIDTEKNELKEKLEFLKIAFRKNKGFERSVEYTKKHDIYRQNYCGCIYSDTFPGGKEQFLAKLPKNNEK